MLSELAIAQALAVGNAVVGKSSEFAERLGEKLPDSTWEADFPGALISAIYGKAEVAPTLIGSGMARAIFTEGERVWANPRGRRAPGTDADSGDPHP